MTYVFDGLVKWGYFIPFSLILLALRTIISPISKRVRIFHCLDLLIKAVWILVNVGYIKLVGVESAVRMGARLEDASKYDNVIFHMRESLEQERRKKDLGL